MKTRLDPLILFVVLGALLVGLHAWTRDVEPVRSDRSIVVTDADIGWMLESFQKRRFRPPTRDELQYLVDRHVRDEVLYREAVALGFDREDPALRRRLASKLEYLARDVGAVVEPTEAELQAWLDEHPARYAEHPRRAFLHVYFSDDRRKGRVQQDAEALLATLRANPEQDIAELGDPILLEPEIPPGTQEDVRGRFGGAFAEALFALPVGGWEGPVRSGYGLHLVRVLQEEPGASPGLDRVRTRVSNDLLQQRKDDALEGYYDKLLEKYEVDVRSSLLADEPARR